MSAAVEPLVAPISDHPPHDADSERAFLGAVLISGEWHGSVTPSDFYVEVNRLVAEAAYHVTMSGGAADAVTVGHRLRTTGKLDRVGGFTYLSELIDAAPSVAHVLDYAEIVQGEAVLRRARSLLLRIEHGEGIDAIAVDLEGLARASRRSRRVGIDLMIEPFSASMAREIEPRGYLAAPCFRERSLSMIYGPKGVGKTNFMLTILVCVAIGRDDVFGWTVPQPRRVMVVDGELDEEELLARIAAICRGLELTEQEMELFGANLLTLSRDRLARAGILLGYLGEHDMQEALREQIPPEISLIAWDNLSCLFGGEENDAGSWDSTLMFLLRLKHERAIASIFLHHSGKGGDQRGTSRREDNLDSSLRLEPVKKDGELTADGTHFRTVWAKHRGFKLTEAPSVVCELSLEPVGPPPHPGGQPPMRARWKVAKTDDVRINVLVEIYGEHLREHGAPPTFTDLHSRMHERAEDEGQPELAIARSTTHKLMSRAKALGLLEDWP